MTVRASAARCSAAASQPPHGARQGHPRGRRRRDGACGSPTRCRDAGRAPRWSPSVAIPARSSRSGCTVVADDEPGDGPVPGHAHRPPARADRHRGRPVLRPGGTEPAARSRRWSTGCGAAAAEVLAAVPRGRRPAPVDPRRLAPRRARRRSRRRGAPGRASLRRAAADLPIDAGHRPRRRPTWPTPTHPRDLPGGRVASAAMDVPEIDVAELAARQAEGAALIDVRRPRGVRRGAGPGCPPHPARRTWWSASTRCPPRAPCT